ncbi:Lsr2 protein [Georgenia satyanarayanai]|uniref:Lsr2 protein n=1 Tax=Georgenia satyanarayanai TaxID=860221 RepID=A0A2Y9A4L2_9MICO|nr:Lsr2 family protein [Georgenia satyanarayanai]PYG01115.1 Lsr2 protein [Georgenia satyanarayanai]SSA39354.1 Lsr2 protein [Georgenia satyanarayanai]
MVQKVMVTLIDDVDGTPADETVLFSLDGVNYEIDLTTDNAAKLRDALAPWVGHARRAGGRRTSGGARSGRRSSGGGGSNDAAKVREWARANGYTVSDRGRIPAEVTEAYAKAN